MKLNHQIRILGLGAALMLSAVGTPALHAVAAAPKAGGPVLHVVLSSVAPAIPVQAGSTGQGPATDADCQQYAGNINDALNAAQQELHSNGMTQRWSYLTDHGLEVQNEAENQGCFIVNPA